MVTWMCGTKVKDRVPSKELRKRLGLDDIMLVLQQNRLHYIYNCSEYLLCYQLDINSPWHAKPSP